MAENYSRRRGYTYSNGGPIALCWVNKYYLVFYSILILQLQKWCAGHGGGQLSQGSCFPNQTNFLPRAKPNQFFTKCQTLPIFPHVPIQTNFSPLAKPNQTNFSPRTAKPNQLFFHVLSQTKPIILHVLNQTNFSPRAKPNQLFSTC